MHDVYCNQRIQKQASCPPWASIQLHGLFAHRSHKSHDTPSCRPWEAGVGTGSELWQAVPSLPEPLSCLPSQPAVGTADSAPGTCKPASPSPTSTPGRRPPPSPPKHRLLTAGDQEHWELDAFCFGGALGALSQEVAHPEFKPCLCLHPAPLGGKGGAVSALPHLGVTDDFRGHANTRCDF